MLPISYGSAPDETGDLYLPAGLSFDSPAALVCLFHGGWWRMPYGRDQLNAMSQDLCAAGLAVWNIGYRRVGEGGTPWPATLRSVELALNHLPAIVKAHPGLDLARVVTAGFSAGGHLAFWAAAKAPHLQVPFRPIAAVALGSVLDLVAGADANVGPGAVQAFIGGTPGEAPERYRLASPAEMLPLGFAQYVVHGDADVAVPITLSEAYVERARAAGDQVELVRLPGVDHMSLVNVGATAYQTVKDYVLRAAGG